MSRKIIRVAVLAPLPGLFDYLPAGEGHLEPGCRVLVPFGRGRRVGVIWQHADVTGDSPYALKKIEKVIDSEP